MSDKLLTSINYPSDLRLLDEAQLQLAQELRNFIIDVVSVKEGHLGASLGVIELTILYLTPQMIY
jgi:1-deoxy-D-xylulose-5-phosphate synthase